MVYRKTYFRIMVVLFLIAFLGCATTDDPRKGGLFSYNPDAYKKRLEERQSYLETLKKENFKEQRKSDEISSELEETQLNKDSLKRNILATDQNIQKIESQIRSGNSRYEKNITQKNEILRKVEEMKAEIIRIKNTDYRVDEKQKQEELDKLNLQLEVLSKEAEVF